MCELFFKCIDGEMAGTTGLSAFLLYLSIFTISFICLIIFEKQTAGDVPTPIVFVFIAALFIALIGVLVGAIVTYLIANNITPVLIGFAAVFIAFILVVISLFIRQRKWK